MFQFHFGSWFISLFIAGVSFSLARKAYYYSKEAKHFYLMLFWLSFGMVQMIVFLIDLNNVIGSGMDQIMLYRAIKYIVGMIGFFLLSYLTLNLLTSKKSARSCIFGLYLPLLVLYLVIESIFPFAEQINTEWGTEFSIHPFRAYFLIAMFLVIIGLIVISISREWHKYGLSVRRKASVVKMANLFSLGILLLASVIDEIGVFSGWKLVAVRAVMMIAIILVYLTRPYEGNSIKDKLNIDD